MDLFNAIRLPSFLGLGALLTLVGCGDDGADTGVDAGVTDAGIISFASDVIPILDANGCRGCHGGNGGLTIGNDPAVSLINVEGSPGVSSGCETAATARVTPGNPEASILFLRIDGRCEQQMPLGGTPLSETERATIRSWILQGANP